MRPAWRRRLPALAALALAVLTAGLGQWQWDKAGQRAARGERLARAALLPPLAWVQVAPLGEAALYRRVRLAGRFAPEHQVWLDNRVRRGEAGYHVITPLRLAAGGAVLVNRGWLPAADRRRPPGAPPPAGVQTLEGRLVHARGRYLELGPAASGRLWQNLDLERYRAWFDPGLPDWLVLQTSPAPDGLIRDWPAPDAGADQHRIYAVQWFLLSALVVGLWGYFSLVRRGG